MFPSALTPARLAARIRFNEVLWDSDGETLLWLEGRAGQGVLCARTGEGPLRELTAEQSVRGGVGYGGGELDAREGVAVFVEKNGRLYSRPVKGPGLPWAVTPPFGQAAGPALRPGGDWVLYVHSLEGADSLAAAPLDGSRWPVQLAAGADFYMQPAWHPNGDRVAWVEWDFPNMPWDGARLMMAVFDPERARLFGPGLIAGGPDIPVFQPVFSPDGRWLSYLQGEGEPDQLVLLDLESGAREVLTEGVGLLPPAWVQGMRAYGWSPDSRYIYLAGRDRGFSNLQRIPVDGGEPGRIDLGPFTDILQLAVRPVGEGLACLASAPDRPDEVITWEGGGWSTVRRSTPDLFSPADFPTAHAIQWKGMDGATVHGIYYAPKGGGSGLPPGIVYLHSGPNMQRGAFYDPDRAYFTSRGWAWLEVQYRGSAGYGRSYLQALYGRWGELDVEDALSGAQAMVDQGLADPRRLVVTGSSAGGYTALNALIRSPGRFRAGFVSYPVTNLLPTVETHKFEARYNERLVGPLPAAAEQYRAWSPLFHAGSIRDPLALFHGSDDPVVPVSQSEEMAAALRANRVPHVFKVYEGEGHRFRLPATLADYYQTVDRFLREHVLLA